MGTNYDLILNFETEDGKELTEQQINDIISSAKSLGHFIEDISNTRMWKVIIAKGVASCRV